MLVTIRNITTQINLAFSKATFWSQSSFTACLDDLTDLIPDGEIDWDEYAGERWGMILANRDTVAYLNREAPLLLLQSKYQNIENYFQNLVVLYFSDIDTPEYSLDTMLFEKWSNGRSTRGAVDNQSLSASDIWWATIL